MRYDALDGSDGNGYVYFTLRSEGMCMQQITVNRLQSKLSELSQLLLDGACIV